LSELTCLELAIGLWFVHLFWQMGAAGRAFTTAYLFSSRDAPPPPKGLVWGRATRAFANYVENLVAFAALDLGLIVTHHAWRRRSGSARASSICRFTCSTSSMHGRWPPAWR